MANRFAVSTGKKKTTSVPTPGRIADFVHGSIPSSLSAPKVPRIKPGEGDTRQYAKDAGGFGNTGQEWK